MNLKTIAAALPILRDNPRLFFQGVSARLKSHKSLPANLTELAELNINGLKVRYRSEYDSYLNRLYYGTHDLAIRAVMKKYLKAGDTFIDIGANIGRITIIALSLVGKSGQVHAFEPIPKYYQLMEDIAADNHEYRLENNHCALGESCGTTTMAVSRTNIGLNSLLSDLLEEDDIQQKVEVPVIRLDDYIRDNNLNQIALIKIDTEGYEFPVLRGLSRFLQSTNRQPPIICEITLEAYTLMDCRIEDLRDYMKNYGYQAYSITIPGKKVELAKMKNNTDVIFIGN